MDQARDTPLLREQEIGKLGQDLVPPQPTQLVSWAHLVSWGQGTTGMGFRPGVRCRRPGTGLGRGQVEVGQQGERHVPGFPRPGGWGLVSHVGCNPARSPLGAVGGHARLLPSKVPTSHSGWTGASLGNPHHFSRGSRNVCLDWRCPAAHPKLPGGVTLGMAD